MFTSLSTIGRFSRQSNHFRLSALKTTPKTYTYAAHRSFGHFFKHKEEEETHKEEPSKKKKKTFLQTAKQALLEGFLKGSDFNRMEKSIILREGKSYEETAEHYFSQAQYQKALENYKIALKLLRDGLGETDPELAYYIGRVGDIYYEVKEWDHAFNSYKESLELLEDSPKNNGEQIARLYFRAAMCCSKGNRYGETVENMKEALKYYSRGKKSEMRDTVMISCNTILAECYTNFGQYTKALEYMEQAIETLERTDTSDGVDLPMAQHSLNYGLILAYANKDYKKAFKYMIGHQTAQIKMNGAESFTAGMSYLRIGDVYSLQGKYTEALDCYKKALETLEKKVGSSDRRVGMCHKAIGQVYGIQGDHQASVKETKKGLECFEEEDFELGQCYRNLAFAYSEMKKEDLAVENLKRSVDTRERMLEGFKEGDPELMVLNGLLVGMLYKRGEYAEAAMCVEAMMKEVCKIITEN